MSTLDQLVARSRSPGQFVERRSFTLSREKAIEKQREFALRHPRQYLLELVQGAVFAGATYIAVDSHPRSLLVAWVGGKALNARELEGLFDYLFADRSDPRWRHLVQLAIGINALCQRAPKLVRIESGDGTTGVRMELDGQFHATIGHSRGPVQGTYVYVEYEVGWLSRFTNTGPTDEQRLVEERCLYTPIPILLNGVAPFGYRGTRQIAVFGARALQHFDQEGRRGVVALHATAGGPTGFRMVVGGVWISTLPLTELATRPLYGVVCDDGLRKTADQSDIVRDASYTRMLHAVQPFATELMVDIEGRGYRAPALPVVPEERAPEGVRPAPQVRAEPLPEMLKVLNRHRVPLAELARSTQPLFWVAPAQSEELTAVTTDGFPWRVLVLSEGQVLTLHQQVPSLCPLRLTSNADVDFVRRVMDQRSRVRSVTVPLPEGRLEVRLHLEGPVPDWGPGIPFCVVGPSGVVEHGGIDGRTVRRSDGRTRELSSAWSLPRVSLVLRDRLGHVLAESHLRAALAAAHALAAPPGEDVDGRLLGAVLAAVGIPQFVRSASDQVTTEVALPLQWPDRLREAPLAPGGLSLERLLAVLGTDVVLPVPDLDHLLALDDLERRLGYGHLSHPTLEGRPLFGVGRFAERWVWLESPQMWTHPGLQQVVWVRATFQARDVDPVFRITHRPHAELAGAVRAGAAEHPWEEGWRVLLGRLQGIEAERGWAQYASGAVTAGRAEGLGRLALIHLASLVGATHVPLLVPSDGGGRRSLDEIRFHAAARAVARRGVRLAEPWTFALTRDELRAVGDHPAGPAHPIRLRYDDGPEVWRSLPESDRGWLVRNEIRVSGLRGWLGLRLPFDPTSGVLLRTTGALAGLSEIERSVPCHGLLWTEDESPTLGAEQRRQAQLAGLRLYQALVEVLDRPPSPETEAARRYGIPFVLVAWRRAHDLTGTARELARRIELERTTGEKWGTLEQWLRTPPADRPAVREVEPTEADAEVLTGPPELTTGLQTRLVDALGAKGLVVIVTRNPRASPTHLAWVETESHRSRVVMGVNTGHPGVRAALERDGPEREILMLELVRLVCRWGREWGLAFDLARAQEALIGQRYGAG